MPFSPLIRTPSRNIPHHTFKSSHLFHSKLLSARCSSFHVSSTNLCAGLLVHQPKCSHRCFSTSSSNESKNNSPNKRRSPYNQSLENESTFQQRLVTRMQRVANILNASEKINRFSIFTKTMPLEQKNGVIFFWLLLVTLVCLGEVIHSWDFTVFGYRIKTNRGIYILWNGEVDKQWQVPLSKKYGHKIWDLLFHSVLGGNESKLTAQLGKIFSGMSQKLINVDALLLFLANFSVQNSATLSTSATESSRETIHFSKEQNKAYDDFLGKVFMNLSHSFPFFPSMVCVRHKEELQKMLSLLVSRLSKEMLPGESIVMPLYTRAKRSDDVQGPHRSYITFTLTSDSSSTQRFVDVSFYDTRTIHWALNPLGKEHVDKKGHVRVDYRHLMLDTNFEENFFDFFTTIARLPNGSYRKPAKEAPVYNFEDYRKFMRLLFGEQCEHIPEQKRKLQIYGTCSWEPLEKIIRDWSGDDKLLAQRFKLDFRRWIFHEVKKLERKREGAIPKEKLLPIQLLKEEVERQLRHDERRLYEIFQEGRNESSSRAEQREMA